MKKRAPVKKLPCGKKTTGRTPITGQGGVIVACAKHKDTAEVYAKKFVSAAKGSLADEMEADSRG